MAELRTPASSCCTAAEQAACCEPSEKSACCGSGPSTCGCSTPSVGGAEEITETHRVHLHAAAAIVRAQKPTP